LTGDELLRALGGYLKSHVSPEDIPSHYGGEEFTLVLPGASCDIVRTRAENLRKGFRGIPLDRGSGVDKGQRTISLLGWRSFRMADEALYQAKMDGKESVVVAGSGPSASPDTTQLPV
jgi:diguanylate cyclase (GGDEF)-like protein